MSKSIQIMLNSEQRKEKPKSWAPAFRLMFKNSGVFQETQPFYALSKQLTFATKTEADRWAENAARQWCADNYPDWTVE